MDEEGVRHPEAVVALAEPEEEAADREEDRERRGGDGVQLLADVEPSRVEELDLADHPPERAAVAEREHRHQRDRPGERGPEVDRLEQGPPPDRLGEAGEVEAQPGAEERAERGRVDPVHRPLGAGPAQHPRP